MKLLFNSLILLIVLGFQSTLFAQESIEKTIAKRGEAVISINTLDLQKIPGLPSYSVDKIIGEKTIMYVNKKQYKNLSNLGIQMQQAPIPSLLHDATMAQNISKAKEWDNYPTYPVYVDMMHQFATNYPDICSIDTIGYTVENRLILTLKISDNVDNNELDEPDFFYTATMHGDETVGYVLMLRLADYLLSNYETNNRVKNMVDNIEIYINPLANPDGTFAGGDYSVSGATRYNANGVDLNRNYPDPVGGAHPDGESYQTENLAMMDFMQSHHFIMSMNFHGGAEVLNYPWDHKYELHPDNAWFIFVSREYADTVHEVDNTYMADFNDGITNGADWYKVYGGRQDYMTHFLHGREITAELSNVKLPSASTLPAYWDKNYRSLLNYIEQVLYGLSGSVTNQAGDPLHAKIYMDGHDDDSSHVWTDTNGNYLRMLEAGSHQITYMAEGYESQTINVTVNNYSQTIQDVVLEKYVAPVTVNISHNANNPTNQSPIVFTVAFSAPITGFEANDLSITNGNASNLQVTDSVTFSVDVTPANAGSVIVKLAADKVNEGNDPSNTVVLVYDNVAPENTLLNIENITENSFDANIKFNENGTMYYAGIAGTDDVPSPDEIVNPDGFLFSGNEEIAANENLNLNITGLESNFNYRFCFVAVDALGNTSETFSETVLTTTVNNKLANPFNIYPNPANDQLFITTPLKVNNIKLVGIDGKTYPVKLNILSDNITSIDLNNLASGIYFITGKTGDKQIARKIIKK